MLAAMRQLHKPAGATLGPWALIQGIGNGQNTSALTLQFTATNLAAGNLVVVGGLTRAASATIADDKSQTWTLQVSQTTSDGYKQYLWTAPVTGTAVGAKPIVTITPGSGNFCTFMMGELDGVDVSTSPVSVSAVRAAPFNNGGGTATAGPTATSGANEAGIMLCNAQGGDEFTNFAGYTQIAVVPLVGGVSLPGVMSVINVNSAAFTGQAASVQNHDDYGAIAACLKLG